MSLFIKIINEHDLQQMYALLDTFAAAFDDKDRYSSNRPSNTYFRQLLKGDYFIALVAEKDGAVVGGLAAYELRKFEQESREIYLYDLAVRETHRREGIATALIEELKSIARSRGVEVIFVQADTDADDQPAIALYSKLSTPEEVLHFDINCDDSDR